MNVELPDGTVLQDVPEGTTRAQIEAKLGRKISAPKATGEPANPYPPANDMTPMEKVIVGSGASLDRAYRGVKSLLGGDTSEGDADAEVYKRNHPGPWATAGEVATDIGTSALPVAGVASRLPMAMRALSLAGVNAAYSGATTPGDMTDRAKAAAVGGGASMIGPAVSTFFPRAGGAALEALQAGGATPTMGMAAMSRDTLANKALTAAENRFGQGTNPRTAYAKELEANSTNGANFAPGFDQSIVNRAQGTLGADAASVFNKPLSDWTLKDLTKATGMGGVGAFAGMKLSVPAAAGFAALNLRPTHRLGVGVMRANDTLATYLERNPQYVPAVAEALYKEQN